MLLRRAPLCTCLRALLPALLLSGAGSLQAQEGAALHPRWSPDGRWIAYYRQEGEDAHIWVVGADGLPLRATRGRGYRSGPTWAPGSDRLAFAATLPDEDPDLWVLELESGDVTRITRTPEREMHPAWSPDGERLAYVALDGDGGSELWTVGVDGTGATRLTETEAMELHPSWTRDGVLLHDVGSREVRRIVALRVATGATRVLTDPERDGSAVTPVADPVRGGVLATLYQAPGEGDLWRLTDGGVRERILELPGDQGSPTLSPDGRNVAFHSDHEGSYAIYLLPLDGGEVLRVSPPGG